MQAGLFRAAGSFFTVGGSWLKMSATMVGRQRKIFKKYWLKRPKANPPKMKTGPEYKWFKISYLQFLFFENITSGIQHFYISLDVPIDITRRSNWHLQTFQLTPPDVPIDIIRFFFLTSDFLAESLKANKN